MVRGAVSMKGTDRRADDWLQSVQALELAVGNADPYR